MKSGMSGLVEVLVRKYPGVSGFVCVDKGDGDQIRDWPSHIERPSDEVIEQWYDEFQITLEAEATLKGVLLVQKKSELVDTFSNITTLEDEIKAADSIAKLRVILLKMAKAINWLAREDIK